MWSVDAESMEPLRYRKWLDLDSGLGMRIHMECGAHTLWVRSPCWALGTRQEGLDMPVLLTHTHAQPTTKSPDGGIQGHRDPGEGQLMFLWQGGPGSGEDTSLQGDGRVLSSGRWDRPRPWPRTTRGT